MLFFSAFGGNRRASSQDGGFRTSKSYLDASHISSKVTLDLSNDEFAILVDQEPAVARPWPVKFLGNRASPFVVFRLRRHIFQSEGNRRAVAGQLGSIAANLSVSIVESPLVPSRLVSAASPILLPSSWACLNGCGEGEDEHEGTLHFLKIEQLGTLFCFEEPYCLARFRGDGSQQRDLLKRDHFGVVAANGPEPWLIASVTGCQL